MDSHESRRKLSDLILQLEFLVKFVWPQLFAVFIQIIMFFIFIASLIYLIKDCSFLVLDNLDQSTIHLKITNDCVTKMTQIVGNFLNFIFKKSIL